MNSRDNIGDNTQNNILNTMQMLHANVLILAVIIFNRKRNQRTRSEDGERQAEESEETPDYLLQLPARRSVEALSGHAVSGAAGESRAGRRAGTHANTGEI